MTTLKHLKKQIIQTMEGAGINAAGQEARMILEHRLGYLAADLIVKAEEEISADKTALIKQDLEMRLSGKSLARIYGFKNFYGLDFKLGPETLEPRSDTETLINAVLNSYKDKAPPKNILDFGTGTGCILITLLKAFPQARGTGSDLSPSALETARENARTHNVESRSQFMVSNWAESIDGEFDLIVSNPPYIESSVIPSLQKEVKNHDPILALDGGKDGLEAYQIIFSHLHKILLPGGQVFFEIGYDQSCKVEGIARDYSFANIQTIKDLSGNPRVVSFSNA